MGDSVIPLIYKNDMNFHKKGKFLCINDNIRIRLKYISSYHLNLNDQNLYIEMNSKDRFIINSGDVDITMNLIKLLDDMLFKPKVE